MCGGRWIKLLVACAVSFVSVSAQAAFYHRHHTSFAGPFSSPDAACADLASFYNGKAVKLLIFTALLLIGSDVLASGASTWGYADNRFRDQLSQIMASCTSSSSRDCWSVETVSNKYEVLYCTDPKKRFGDDQCQIPPAPLCTADTIPGGDIMNGVNDGGGDINVGGGAGIYDVGGCAYTCQINYDKWATGTVSLYDSQECTGLAQEYTDSQPSSYQDPDVCSVRDSLGRCLEMGQQVGNSCPSGTTYGQVNGVDVCVPSGVSLDGVDEGTQGKTGEGGSEPMKEGTGEGVSDGQNDGGTDSYNKSNTTGIQEGTESCTEETAVDGTVTKTCTSTTTTSEETDYGEVTVPGLGENQFYKPVEKTAESVVQDFNTKVGQTELVKGVSGFFDVNVGGTCPVWSTPAVWVFDPITIDMQCSSTMDKIWPFIAAIIVGSCGVVAFRWALL